MIFKFKHSMDFFDTFAQALEVAENVGIPKDEIICLTNDEYEQLFKEELTEIPDESSAMTPIEWLRSQKDRGNKPITLRDPSNELPAHNEDLNTNNYLQEFVLRGIQNIKEDPTLPSCPYCSRSWENIEAELAPQHREELAIYAGKPLKFKDAPLQEKQNGGLRNQNRQYADAKIPLKIQHLKTKHVGIYRMLKDAGIVLQFETVIDDYGNSILKPTNKRNTEHLSDTELATRIQENPELRRQFFKRWIESLQK